MAMALESPKSWMDEHLWGGRFAFLALGAATSLFVRAGLINYQHEQEVRATTTIEVRASTTAADNHKIRKILAAIPAGSNTKPESLTTAPDCVGVTPIKKPPS